MRRLYSLVTRGLWSDSRFLALSGPEPNARTLWLFLLTGDVQGPIPGLFRAGVGSLADGLGWPVEETESALAELEEAGLVRVSRLPPLLWLPKAGHHNPPASPNVVRGWRSAYQELPECDLREEAMAAIRGTLPGEAFLQAFDSTFGDLMKPSRKPFRKPSGKDERFGPSEAPSEASEATLFLLTQQGGKPSGKPSGKDGASDKKKKKKVGEDPESPGLPLAEHLREEIRTHTPRIADRYPTPGKLAGWAKDLDKLVRLDGAAPEEVRRVITWAHRGDPRGFWRGNLLSGAKVREHFDRLLVQARQAGAPISASPVGDYTGWMEEHHRWLLRWRDEERALGREPDEAGLRARCNLDGIPVPSEPSRAIGWLRRRA